MNKFLNSRQFRNTGVIYSVDGGIHIMSFYQFIPIFRVLNPENLRKLEMWLKPQEILLF